MEDFIEPYGVSFPEALAGVRDYRQGLSRTYAATVLYEVADLGSSGNFPREVTGQDIGLSLFRVVSNSAERDPLAGIAIGWLRCEVWNDIHGGDPRHRLMGLSNRIYQGIQDLLT